MSDAAQQILLTGATGAVGRESLARMIRHPGNRVVCLVRAATDEEASQRISTTLDELAHHGLSAEEQSRVVALRGDITQEHMGLERAKWEALAAETTRIVHGAANVSWSLPLEEARRINVTGTSELLRLAEAACRRGTLQAFDYLSTVMVAGKRQGLIGEEELDSSAGFWSTYEQSKAEAEGMVRSRRGSLPVSVFRLSMVVGDSRTGHTSSFNVMYWPLKMLSRGMFWIAPADPEGVVDIVPVDYTVDAVEALSADPAQRGKCFHIAAGPQCCCTVSQFLDLAVEVMGIRRPILLNPAVFFTLVRPLILTVTWGKRREAFHKARVYVPYLSYKARFDDSQVRAALEPLGLRPPPVQTYFRNLIDYAIATEWGKHSRKEAARGAAH
ncbi:MAG TPA: SDR family oxidoreductase [Bryobacteraceae bacterium]|nr:SDR family oxidoreductase [Bryobacteraceae bacterium]